MIYRQEVIDMVHYSIELCNKALDSLTLGGKDRYAIEVERNSLLELEDDIKLLLPAQPERDCIYRGAAIDAMANTLWHYPNECYRNLNKYEFAKGLAELGLKSVPSAQPEQQMKCDGCRYDNHASGWSEHCVLCRRNYLSFKDRYKE